MAWLDGFSDLKTVRERAETALYVPIGMMSPLWIAFGAAASAGATVWLLSRLAKPVNIEAAMAPSNETAPAMETKASTILPVDDVVIGTSEVEACEVEAAAEPEEAAVIADDLTQLTGVGPKIARALAERGVQRFAQLAAWTEQDLAGFDAALDLRGKAIRAGFVTQARMLAGEA